MDELNPTSRGENWETMKANRGKSLGRENPNGKNKWFEHPGAGKSGVPKHHSGGHIHSTNPKGEAIIIAY